ncbi:hypothetical protein ACLIBH_01950 [Virgibacillus sp. W0430]|uniref:hypothetical protein n=1 Tax=Virgibacillus sp. W0430 TaxID=3391580 RepID=UPI003F448590
MTFINIKAYGYYAVIFFTVMLGVIIAEYKISEYASMTFNYFFKMTFVFTVYPLIGCLVGFVHIRKERKKEGKWQLNIGKLLVFAVPAFFFAYYPFLIYFGPLSFLSIPSVTFNQAILAVPSTLYIFEMILGYTVITSFYKKRNAASSL